MLTLDQAVTAAIAVCSLIVSLVALRQTRKTATTERMFATLNARMVGLLDAKRILDQPVSRDKLLPKAFAQASTAMSEFGHLLPEQDRVSLERRYREVAAAKEYLRGQPDPEHSDAGVKMIQEMARLFTDTREAFEARIAQTVARLDQLTT